MSISVEIWRSDGWLSYSLNIHPDGSLTILDILNFIKEEKEPTLSYRSMCRSGVCGTCAVRVNSKPVLACKTKVLDFGDVVKIEPLLGLPVVKDLVVDHGILVNRVKGVYSKEIKEFKVLHREYIQSVERSFECILCGVCDSVCPVILEAPYFGGPMAFLRSYKHLVDGSEGNAQSTVNFLKTKFVNLCTHCKNCSIACPKMLHPEQVITQEEERLVQMGVLEKPNQQSSFDFLSF